MNEINELLLIINNENKKTLNDVGFLYLSYESSIYNLMKRSFMPGSGETLKSFGTSDDMINFLVKEKGE